MSQEQPCSGCGFLMSPQALAHHYPFVHGPRPLLVPDFYQRDDGIIRCLVTRADKITPWCQRRNTRQPVPEPTQPALF